MTKITSINFDLDEFDLLKHSGLCKMNQMKYQLKLIVIGRFIFELFLIKEAAINILYIINFSLVEFNLLMYNELSEKNYNNMKYSLRSNFCK